MEKILKKRITILIILVIMIIIEILAFGLSRARVIEEIGITIVDYENLLGDEEGTLNAINDGESGYYIILPEMLNDKSISKYMIEDIALEETVEIIPGSRIYLTDDELEEQSMTLSVVYDTKEVDEKLLYYKKIKAEVVEGTEIENEVREITVSGYMPANAEISLAETNFSALEEVISDEYNLDFLTISQIYNIKIVSDEEEYHCADFEEELRITISGMENNMLYTLVSMGVENELEIETEEIEEDALDEEENPEDELLNEEEDLEELEQVEENPIEESLIIMGEEDFEITDDIMSFTTTELSTYALLEIENIGFMEFEDINALALAITTSTEIPWDGSVATAFKYGTGTQSDPFLITDGSELAYLAERVNAGNLYAGQYFQLTNNIDLSGLAWTPIGTTANEFRGIFDGAGHNISNAVITTDAFNVAGIKSYGIFGAIGYNTTSNLGTYTYAEIRNVEFNNITVTMNVTGTAPSNSGFHIGIVAGTIYNKAKITNCIVKGSEINTSATYALTSNIASIFLGGIAGSVGTTTNTDPGAANRYSIENCYVSANISTAITGTGQYAYKLSSGGIVGRIHNQPVWPSNCLYTGTINPTTANTTASNGGFIGPIFGSVTGTATGTVAVAPSNATNRGYDDTVFSGTGIGSLTMTSYYTNFTARRTTFTTTLTSGALPTSNNPAYRVSVSTSNNDMSRYQGINKGIYTNSMPDMLTMFNSYVGNNNNVSWEYVGGNFSLIERHTSEINENLNLITANIVDRYSTGTYTYKWYLEDAVQSNNTDSYSVPAIRNNDYNFAIVTYDGEYYGVTKFVVEKTKVDIKLVRTGDSLNAILVAESDAARNTELSS